MPKILKKTCWHVKWLDTHPRSLEAGGQEETWTASPTSPSRTARLQHPGGVQTLYLDEGTAEAQCARVAELRDTRDGAAVDSSLDRLRHAALGTDNLMPLLIEAVRACATLGEMCDALRDVWGESEETPSV